MRRLEDFAAHYIRLHIEVTRRQTGENMTNGIFVVKNSKWICQITKWLFLAAPIARSVAVELSARTRRNRLKLDAEQEFGL